MPFGELVPLALFAVLVARPIVNRLANFLEDFLRLLDPPGPFEKQGITGARFLARVLRDQRGVFIKRSIRLPLLFEALRIEQMAIGRGVTRIGLPQPFQRDLSFVRVSDRKQCAGQAQHQSGIGRVNAAQRFAVESRRRFGLAGEEKFVRECCLVLGALGDIST